MMHGRVLWHKVTPCLAAVQYVGTSRHCNARFRCVPPEVLRMYLLIVCRVEIQEKEEVQEEKPQRTTRDRPVLRTFTRTTNDDYDDRGPFR